MSAFFVVVQTVLFLAHGAVYATAAAFLQLRTSGQVVALGAGLLLLSLTFVPASVLAFSNPRGWVKALYRSSVVWLGLLNYLFFGAGLCWAAVGINGLVGSPLSRSEIGAAALGLSLLAGLAAFVNAQRIRIRRLPVMIPGLPDAWKGRRIAVVSDVHLGHVRGAGFLRRLVRLIAGERPDLVVVPGDLYDGTAVDPVSLAAPWAALAAPQGILFVTGNHEEFRPASLLTAPLAGSGVRVLNNEKILLDGLQIVGIPDGEHRDPVRLSELLRGMRLDPTRASLLLAHAPVNLRIAEQAGVSLQISGHTHGGQFLPWTWVVSRIYGAFARGLHSLGRMQVLTTTGAGTWGPPMRLGSNPEIVLLLLA